MLLATDADSILELVAVHLRPLETVSSTETPICSSAQLFLVVVGFGDESHVGCRVDGITNVVGSDCLGVQTVKRS